MCRESLASGPTGPTRSVLNQSPGSPTLSSSSPNKSPTHNVTATLKRSDNPLSAENSNPSTNGSPIPSPWLQPRTRSPFLSPPNPPAALHSLNPTVRPTSFFVFRTHLARSRSGPLLLFPRVRWSWIWVGEGTRCWMQAEEWGRQRYELILPRLWTSRWLKLTLGLRPLWTSIWAIEATLFTSDPDFLINPIFSRGTDLFNKISLIGLLISIPKSVFWEEKNSALIGLFNFYITYLFFALELRTHRLREREREREVFLDE